MLKLNTHREQRAYIEGLERREEVRRIMASAEYQRGDRLAHARVEAFYREVYGGETVPGAPTSPGQAAADPFSRRED